VVANMVFIRKKKIKGSMYYYLVKSARIGNELRKYEKYIGKKEPTKQQIKEFREKVNDKIEQIKAMPKKKNDVSILKELKKFEEEQENKLKKEQENSVKHIENRKKSSIEEIKRKKAKLLEKKEKLILKTKKNAKEEAKEILKKYNILKNKLEKNYKKNFNKAVEIVFSEIMK